jgi:hypothetical protein
MRDEQRELAERALKVAGRTAKILSDVKKKMEPHHWVLSKDSGGGYLVTIGDPRKSSSKIIARFSGHNAKEELRLWVKYEMPRKVSEDHVFDATGLKLVPEFYSEFYVENMLKKTADRHDALELAEQLLKLETNHPAFKAIGKKWDEIVKALGKAKDEAARLERVGAGGTEEDTLVKSYVMPAMEAYHKTFGIVIDQMKQKLGR